MKIRKSVIQILYFPSLLLLFSLPFIATSTQTEQIYIAYFGDHSGEKSLQEIENYHLSYLNSVKETDEEARNALIYSYKYSINGFSAMLTADQASKLSELEEVVSVYPSQARKYVRHTTRSWEFVGLEGGERLHWYDGEEEGLLSKAKYGKDIIIGHFDSGIWPEAESFSDEGIGPIPKSWKGICQTGPDFNSSHCNRKIIGARYYLDAYERVYGPLNTTLDTRSPRDLDGHGTHTASTAAGRRVRDVSFQGRYALGTASGGAPLARIAVYKVCWAVPNQEKALGNVCMESDMLKAMDQAIYDGVDIMTLSIGTSSPMPFTEDGIAVGALHAAKRNILVACSAGNSGPAPGTLSNPAPWIITVAASSLDRQFLAPVVLGNGARVQGHSLTKYVLKKMHPLVHASDVELPNVPKNASGLCLANSLSSEKAKGKIVFCVRGKSARIMKGEEVKRARGAGFILGNTPEMGEDAEADPHYLPATAVGATNAITILKYINSTKNPKAIILPGTTVVHTKPAPYMAYFTSRGPNLLDPNTLKPDIAAPGINILAAWSGADSISKLSTDHRMVKWNFDSGTSMACPHVAATAILLRAVHPSWSAPAIRSAMITTAGLLNNEGGLITDEAGEPADPFQYGAGQLRPSKAADPGLVYDANYIDYILYSCNLGLIMDKTFGCPEGRQLSNQLNYPSLAIANYTGRVTVQRTVTNVGGSKSIYFASVKPPLGYRVEIKPSILYFRHRGDKKSFTITVEAERGVFGEDEHPGKYRFGWLTWHDGIHTVRSPMVVSTP